jgi:hypothetical protein
MTSDNEGYFWPTAEQEYLLKAVLLKGQAALSAWKSWAAIVDFDRLDAGSQRLLPLLYKNLVEQEVRHPVIEVYKGFYRMAWYKNHLLCHRLIGVLRLFKRHGISALLLKGVALISLYYQDWALRPMNDFDLLVDRDQALRAIDLLCRHGWSLLEATPAASDLQARHACTLVDATGIELDLHWRVMHESGRFEDDDFFKDAAMRIDFNGMSVSVLSSTDQLFHVLVHGVRWNPIAPLRWVPDAMMILRQDGVKIDWQRFLREARNRRLVAPLKKSLIYLADEFAAPIPVEIMTTLRPWKPSVEERLEHWMNSRPRGLLRDTLYLWFAHVRTSKTSGLIRLLIGFPSFLGTFWKVPEQKSTGWFLASKFIKRIIKGPGCAPGHDPAH